MPKRLTQSEFIYRSICKHGDRYLYDEVEYVNQLTTVIITCKMHGNFKQVPYNHMNGCGCQKCDITISIGTEKFIERSNIVHNNRYDYYKSIYGNNNYDHIIITCKKHGDFKQRPWSHLRGQGCPICADNKKRTTSEFIKESMNIHTDLYNYNKVNYINKRKLVIITCKKHGDFKQRPDSHLNGHGCPKCNMSKLEKYVSNILSEIGIIFEYEKRFKDCRNVLPLPFDFYLPEYNILIECDGIQHSESIDFFGGIERLEYQKSMDKIKNIWVNKSKYSLIRVNNNNICEFKNELNKNINI